MSNIRCNRKVLALRNGKDYADVMFIGDVHLGSPQCDKQRFIANLDFCFKNNLYVFLMGDLLEMATRDSVGAGVYEQESIGQTQYEQMVEMLSPLAKKGLILGSHNGNHEERIYKFTGINIAKILARELNVTYLHDACWSKFKVGSQNYSLYTLHGRAGARFDGTALLALERISVSFDADFVACGHSHKAINSIVLMQREVNGRIVEHKKHLCICGSYLNYDHSYAQTVGLPISKLGSPRVRFYASKKDIVVTW